jgi:hypothetical protein
MNSHFFEKYYAKLNYTKDGAEAMSSCVITDVEGKVIFARTIDMDKKEIISTEWSLDDEHLKTLLDFYYSLDYIFKDSIVLAFEMIRDINDYRAVSLRIDDKYGALVFQSDIDSLELLRRNP